MMGIPDKSQIYYRHFVRMIVRRKWFFVPYFLVLAGGIVLWTRIHQGDEVLYFVRFRGMWTDDFFANATHLGEPMVLGGIALVLLWLDPRRALAFVSAVLTAGLVAGLTKLWFHHDRPYLFFEKLGRLKELVGVPGVDFFRGNTSFPSGHTLAAFSAFGLLALMYGGRRIWQLVFFLLALAVGISRMYLGQHFLKDVMAGSVLGVLVALTVHHVYGVMMREIARRGAREVVAVEDSGRDTGK